MPKSIFAYQYHEFPHVYDRFVCLFVVILIILINYFLLSDDNKLCYTILVVSNLFVCLLACKFLNIYLQWRVV